MRIAPHYRSRSRLSISGGSVCADGFLVGVPFTLQWPPMAVCEALDGQRTVIPRLCRISSASGVVGFQSIANAMEVKRQLDMLDRNLAERRYLGGDEYTIADMATYPWYGTWCCTNIYDATEGGKAPAYGRVQHGGQSSDAENHPRSSRFASDRPGIGR